MRMPRRCTSGRWRSEKRHLVPIIPMLRPGRETASKIVGLRARSISGSAVGLAAWYGFAINASVALHRRWWRALYELARKWPLSTVFVDFNGQYVRTGRYGEVWDFFPVPPTAKFYSSPLVATGRPPTGDVAQR